MRRWLKTRRVSFLFSSSQSCRITPPFLHLASPFFRSVSFSPFSFCGPSHVEWRMFLFSLVKRRWRWRTWKFSFSLVRWETRSKSSRYSTSPRISDNFLVKKAKASNESTMRCFYPGQIEEKKKNDDEYWWYQMLKVFGFWSSKRNDELLFDHTIISKDFSSSTLVKVNISEDIFRQTDVWVQNFLFEF